MKVTNTAKYAFLGVAPSGHYVWGLPEESAALHIGRARPDGTPLPSLRYDFAPEYPDLPYEGGRQLLIEKGQRASDGMPWGFAFVTQDNLPENTGLNDGDVLVADLGHRENIAILGQALNTRPGLWRFRLDDDAPARRLATMDRENNCAADIAVARQGVFVLNLINQRYLPEDDPPQLTDRLVRWDKAGWHKCLLDQPIANAGGLAADPLSSDLYVVQGAASVTPDSKHQRILRLIPTGPDRYHVEVIADRFNKLSYGGVAFSQDGKRMIITDKGSRAMVVLRRKK